jgi:tetratricopeptide (TPR) repeat protein
LYAACALAWWQGDSGTGIDMGEQSVAIFRSVDDRQGLEHALRALGQATLSFPDSTLTIPCLEESIALCRDMPDTLGLMKALFFYGWKLCNVGDFERARSLLEESYHLAQELGALNMQAWITGALVFASSRPVDLTTLLPNYEKALILFRQAGNKLGELQALQSGGHILGGQGHYDQAQKHFQKILSLWLKYGNKANAATALYYLGVYTWLQGFLPEAKSRFLECLEMLREVNIHDFFIASCLFMLTKIIKVEDCPERIATMLGAADMLRSKTIPISEENDNEYNRIWDAVHQYLEGNTFATAYDRGLAMTREQAITFGLEVGAMLE